MVVLLVTSLVAAPPLARSGEPTESGCEVMFQSTASPAVDSQPASNSEASPCPHPQLRSELLAMAQQDQAVRGRINSEGETPELLEEESRIDWRNTARMKLIVDEYGWPTQSMVGKDGAKAAWLMAMHADHDTKFQHRCLDLMKAALEHDQVSAIQVAYLTDRVRTREGKPQVYGTQYGVIDGVRRYFPIEDLKHVEKRRAEVGLPPLGEYRELPKSLVIMWGKPRPGPAQQGEQGKKEKLSERDDSLSGLDAYIRKAMAEWQVPGLAIAVVKDDQIVFLKGYGVREVGKDAPVDEQTIFPLSSMTKAFTAAAVGILVDEGKLSWDDPVVKHLPWFQLPDPWVTRQVTLRDLLAHRVGGDLGRHLWILSLATTFSPDEQLRRLPALEPGEPRFRSRFYYNNTSFAAVGKVLEAVSGMSWEEFIQARLLQPLDMTSATTSPGDLWDTADLQACWLCELPARAVSFEDALIENIVMVHLLAEEGALPVPWPGGRGSHPAWSISTNIQDAAKWIRLHLAKGLYEGKKLLSTEVVKEMHTPQIPISYDLYPLGPGSGHFWAYGLGWFLTDYRARKVVINRGGFHSFIAMMPEENLGVAVLTNLIGGRPMANYLRVALPFRVFDAYLGVPKRDWSAELLAKAKADRERREAQEEKLKAQRIAGTQPSLPLEKYLGTYTHPAFGEVKITKENSSLVLRFHGGGGSGELEHWHYDVFLLTWKGLPLRDFVVFAIDPAGRVQELRIVFPPEPPAIFQRLSGSPQTE